MRLNLLSKREAVIAFVIGAAAGWLAVNAFKMPDTLLIFIASNMRSVYEVFRTYFGGEIALVAYLHRLPGVLIAGLLIGSILPRIRYRRVLLISILIWPVFLILRLAFTLVLLEIGGRETGRRGLGILFLQTNAGLEIAVHIAQYVSLFLILLATNWVVVRAGKRNLSRNGGA